MSNTIWHCHMCGEGPYNATIILKCLCGHEKCPDCFVTTVTPEEPSELPHTLPMTSFGAGSLSALAPELATISPSTRHFGSTTFNPAANEASILDTVSVSTTSSVFCPTASTSVTFGELNSTAGSYTTVGGKEDKTKKYYMWRCCNCGDSLNSVKYDYKCIHNCGHQKCPACPVEAAPGGK